MRDGPTSSAFDQSLSTLEGREAQGPPLSPSPIIHTLWPPGFGGETTVLACTSPALQPGPGD